MLSLCLLERGVRFVSVRLDSVLFVSVLLDSVLLISVLLVSVRFVSTRFLSVFFFLGLSSEVFAFFFGPEESSEDSIRSCSIGSNKDSLLSCKDINSPFFNIWSKFNAATNFRRGYRSSSPKNVLGDEDTVYWISSSLVSDSI